MVNWQITATTIYCDTVDDEVTVMVSKDWSIKCTGFKKYTQPNQETKRLVNTKNRQLKRQLRCEGPECPRVLQYRDKLMAEEKASGQK